jgi:RNA polymerase sigma-70 factor (ECF subfamily)
VLRHNDAAAFAYLVNKHKTMAFNIAMRITRSREESEEVAQDAFIKLYRSLSQFKGEAKFTTWFYRIVYNLALARIRKKSLFTGSTDDEQYVETDTLNDTALPDQLGERDRNRYVREAIALLDDDEQLLITLFYMDDQPIDEIASITGLSVSNVKVRLFRSRKKLQEHLNALLKDELHSIL